MSFRNQLLAIHSRFIRMPQKTDGHPFNRMDLLESLTRNIEKAKGILNKFPENEEPIPGHELTVIIEQMESTTYCLHEALSSVPSSTFENNNKQVSVNELRSPSKEVEMDLSEVTETQETKPTEISVPSPEQIEVTSTETATAIELDLSSVQCEVSKNSSYLADMQILGVGGQGSRRSSMSTRASSSRSTQDYTQFPEPLFASFFCPLANKIMEDPVTLLSGATFERQAINHWFERDKELEEVICPVTGKRLKTRVMYPNMALKAVIEEWKERNERSKIKIVHAALSLASTESMVLEALKDLQGICQNSPEGIREVRAKGILSLLVNLLEYRDSSIRSITLEILHQLVQDDEGMELIGKTAAVSRTVRMISSRYQPVRHAALILLMELSKSPAFSEKIGRVNGGILILIKIKYNRPADTFASEAADQILRNLSQSSYNIRCMAENGFLEPLLENLAGGLEEMKLEMARYLVEIIPGHDNSIIEAKRIAPALIEMICNGKASTRKAALQALIALSSYEHNKEMLLDAGIIKIIVEQMFTRKKYEEGMDALKEAATILANLFESDLKLQNVEVNDQGHTVASDYVVFNIVYMLRSCKVDELSLSLVRIISSLVKWSRKTVVLAVTESQACYTVVELINHPDEKIAIVALKLLSTLSADMGQILIDRLCKVSGQPEGLIQGLSDLTQITERQVVYVQFLAKLPHDNLTLNLALLGKNIVPTILQTISHIQSHGTEIQRAGAYLEGLVGVLVRFTATIYEPQMLFLAMNNDFTSVFRDLLVETNNAEVKTLVCRGLEKLSEQSINLSKPPQMERRRSYSSFHGSKFLSFGSPSKMKVTLCPVHKGVCSSKSTFCLVESKALEGLTECLENHDKEMIDAALSALSTLLGDRVDAENSVKMLHEMKGTQKLMHLVRSHKNKNLLHKSLWMMERFLMKGGEICVAAALSDKAFRAKVQTTFYLGDDYSKQMAEKILGHLNQMPCSSITFAH